MGQGCKKPSRTAFKPVDIGPKSIKYRFLTGTEGEHGIGAALDRPDAGEAEEACQGKGLAAVIGQCQEEEAVFPPEQGILLAAQALPGPGWGLEQGFRLWGGLPGIPASG